MTDIFDALEICLREIESGADLESALARFPEHAAELRPILKTAAKARSMASAEPSAETVRRGRARVLQAAAEMRESRLAPRRRATSGFQRLVISFAMTALLLISGVGLINASASALPGEGLYPVKRGWENIRLLLIFDPQAREMLENQFENERLHEANELLAEGRHEVIQFAGVFMQVNGATYVSGLRVILPPGMPLPANGDAVIVSGRTNAQGYVEVISLELLPAGSVVPLGNPVEMELESDSEDDQPAAGESGAGSGNEAGATESAEYEISGTLQAVSSTFVVVNGMTVSLDESKIKGQLCVGMEVEVIGYYADDGSFVATEVEGSGKCEDGAPSNSNGGGSDENNNDDENEGIEDNENSDDDSNGDDSNDDDSSDDDSNGDDSSDDDSNDDSSDDQSGGDDD